MANPVGQKTRQYVCPLCQRTIRVPERYVGYTGACKRCGGRITVRENEAVAAPPSAATADPFAAPPQMPVPTPAPVAAAPRPAPKPVQKAKPAPASAKPAKPAQKAKPAAAPTPTPEFKSPAFSLDTLPEPAHRVAEPEPETPPSPETLLEWLEKLPRSAPSVREQEEKRPKPLFLSDDDLARSKTYFDIPLLVARKGEAVVLVRTTRDNIGPGTSQAVASGDLDFAAACHAMAEFPVLQLVFTVRDNAERPLRFESLPILTDGNVLEFMAAALREKRIHLGLYAGSQANNVAAGDIVLSNKQADALTDALVEAIRQWRKDKPKAAQHEIAANRFAREHPLHG